MIIITVMKFSVLILGVFGAVYIIYSGVKENKVKNYLSYAGSMLLVGVVGFITVDFVESDLENHLKGKELIVHEANMKFDSDDAYISQDIKKGIYEVIVGEKVYHGYLDAENDKVRFLEKGEFE